MSEDRKPLFGRIKASLLLKVLAIYIGASWLVLQIIDVLNSTLGLPTWYIPAAIGLLLIGLPIILATAMVQAGLRQEEAPQSLPGLEFERVPEGSSARAHRSDSTPNLALADLAAIGS